MSKIVPYVINLKRAAERREYMKRQFSDAGIKPYIVPAYDGHDKTFPFFIYKDLMGQWWNNYERFKPGAVACFLSHAKVWKYILKGPLPWGVVFEDDIDFNNGAFDRVLKDIGSKDFDVIFIDSSMHAWVSAEEKQTFVEISSYLVARLEDGSYSKHMPWPSASAYVVSKKGARKLLYMMESRGINMGVDYAMVLNTLRSDHQDRLEELPDEQVPFPVRCLLNNEKYRFVLNPPICLDNYIYTPEFVAKQRTDIDSTIKHEIFLQNGVLARPSLMRFLFAKLTIWVNQWRANFQ